MSMTEAARQIRKLIEITANNLTDEQAAELPYCFPEWKEGMEVKEGERYALRGVSTFMGDVDEESEDAILSESKETHITTANNTPEEPEGAILFKCKKTHITTANNAPEESPELWEVL